MKLSKCLFYLICFSFVGHTNELWKADSAVINILTIDSNRTRNYSEDKVFNSDSFFAKYNSVFYHVTFLSGDTSVIFSAIINGQSYLDTHICKIINPPYYSIITPKTYPKYIELRKDNNNMYSTQTNLHYVLNYKNDTLEYNSSCQYPMDDSGFIDTIVNLPEFGHLRREFIITYYSLQSNNNNISKPYLYKLLKPYSDNTLIYDIRGKRIFKIPNKSNKVYVILNGNEAKIYKLKIR